MTPGKETKARILPRGMRLLLLGKCVWALMEKGQDGIPQGLAPRTGNRFLREEGGDEDWEAERQNGALGAEERWRKKSWLFDGKRGPR